MPLYDYECRNCSCKLLDIKQGFDQEPLSLCPECDQPKLYRVISGGAHAFVKGSNTIGSVADNNAKRYKSRVNEAQAKKREETVEPEKVAYRGNASNREIKKMTPDQQKIYIMEGKK